MASARSGTAEHDVGHALATLRFAAAALAETLPLDRVDPCHSFSDSTATPTTPGAERDIPNSWPVVVRGNWASDRGSAYQRVASQGAASRWYGTANVLSPEHALTGR